MNASYRPQFSILGLVVVVGGISLALASLMHASTAWAGIMRLAYFAALGTAPLGVVYLRGRRQAFSLGFALWAWGYLVLESVPGVPVASPLLSWSYSVMIPPGRQADRIREAQYLAFLEKGQTIEELGDVADVLADGVTVAEGVMLGTKRGEAWTQLSGGRQVPTMVRVWLEAGPDVHDRLETSETGRNPRITLKPRRPATSSPLAPADRVHSSSFLSVGHAIFGILAGLCGGMVGQRIQAQRGDGGASEVAMPRSRADQSIN